MEGVGFGQPPPRNKLWLRRNKLRILWSSNSPFVPSAYGQQSAAAAVYLKRLGHEVALFAFYGLEGAKVDWGDIPIYPNNARDWGIKDTPMFYEDFKADLLITLVDAWVEAGLDPRMNWVPWMPVDHKPAPPLLLKVLKESPGLIKPIVISKFGQVELEKQGIESYYIPHGVDTDLYNPNPEWRKISRERYKWEDKFVIGVVATNHGERKNYIAAMKAVKMFSDMHKDEVIYYMHTDPISERGINLVGLRDALNLKDIIFFPSRVQMATGIDRETMARIYNVMDVFLLPSKGEGFGIPIVEAQACGVPVVITDCTGHAELMGGGWFIKDLIPQWTGQGSWQFDCHPEEIVERLEEAYIAKKDGSIKEIQGKARKKALEYNEEKLFTELWPLVLADIEERIKQPKNLEGVQQWRLGFIPRTCVPRKVLDIGCGAKQTYRSSLEHLGEYIGIDTKNGDNVLRCDAHYLPFQDKEFGFVWMSELLEHVENPEQVLTEAKRVGVHGVCLFSTPLNRFFKMDPEHRIVNIPYTTIQSGDGLISW